MSSVETLLAQFADEWNAGRTPSVADYLEQLPEGPDRDELAAQIDTFLTFAPTPDYDEGTLARLRAEPAVRAGVAAFAGERGAWSLLLPRLRERAGLSLRDLAEKVLLSAGRDPGGADKAARHLEAMERGELDATSVSPRLLGVLGRVLGISRDELVRAGTPAAAGGTLFRRQAGTESVGARLDMVADALTAPAPGRKRDEVDELFFSEGEE